MRKQNNLTCVKFFRFEAEVGAERELYKRTIWQRAEPRPWLSLDMLKAIQASTQHLPTKKVDEKRQTNWWGMTHHVQERVTEPMSVFSAATVRKEAFRLMTREHDYVWDAQSLGGVALELVLEARRDEERFEQVAALLVSKKYKADPTLQRFVVNSLEGWHEPIVDSPEAKSYLFTISLMGVSAQKP